MNLSSLSPILRRRRQELSLDQRDLAEIAGVSLHALSNLESGKANPTLRTLTQVCDALGLEWTVALKRTPADMPEGVAS